MEWLRQRREVRQLKSRIEEIDSDIRRIKDIRKRLQEDKGLLLKQREMMGRDIDAIIKDRQELLRSVPAAERLAFLERTLSYIALKTNISSGDSIKKDYKGLLLSEMEGKEYYLILEKKHRIEEIDSDIRRIKDIRKRLQEDKGLLLKQREMMGRDIDAIIKDRQELLRSVPAAERLAFSELTLSYIALKTNISSGDSIKKDYKGLLLSEMGGKEYYLILEKKQIKRQISELSPWITNRYIIFSVCIMPVYFMYMYGWWMRVNGE